MFKFVKRWIVFIKLKGFSSAAIVITLIFSVAVIGLTIYGTKVGNFVVLVEQNTDISLLLCEKEDFVNRTPRLMATGLKEMTNCTIYDFDIAGVARLDGSSNDNQYKRYFAYNFYIKNFSGIAVNYEAKISIKDSVFRNVDEALRVMIITDQSRGITQENTSVYAKLEKYGMPPPLYNVQYVSIDALKTMPLTDVFFHDENNEYTISRQRVDNFRVNQIMKYTIIMWLEGEDEDCTDELLGGSIKMEMFFAAEKRVV